MAKSKRTPQEQAAHARSFIGAPKDPDAPRPAHAVQEVRKHRFVRRRSAKKDRKIILDQEQAGKAIEMRKEGRTLEEIGKALDLSGPTVARIIRETSAQALDKKASAYLDLSLRRLEVLLGSVWERAVRGTPDDGPDLEAIEQARKLIADTRALTGIDAPKRQELTGAEGGPIALAAQAGERMQERMAAMAARLKAGEEIQVVQKTPETPAITDPGEEDEQEAGES